MKPDQSLSRIVLIIFCLASSFCIQLRAQVFIPANDNDIENVMKKIAPLQQFAAACNAGDCIGVDCKTLQDLQFRVRDARMYMRYLYYWLQRATDAQMENLRSIAGESILAGERAAEIQKITAWQQWVVGIAAGLLEVASAGANFSEIVSHPKLLGEKTKKEMADLFDKFYEGMKDAESLIHRLVAGKTDKDFPQPFAKMMPAFAGLTSDEMNELKSHLSDVKGLLEAGVEHGKDWKKVLKEGKGLASIGQIAGRFLKAYAESEIEERERLVEDLLAGIIANDKVQSQSFKDWQRVQQRRNKAEDAYRAIEDLVMISANGEGSLTRCLMKNGAGCMSLDLGYTSGINVPAAYSASSFLFATDEDKAKSYSSAAQYFNAKIPEVINLLSNVPAIPKAIANTLKATKKVFKPGEEISIQFTAAACLDPTSWVGVFSVFHPHVDDLASSFYILSGRGRLEGKSSGSLTFKAPNNNGAYQLRMFETGTGKEIASYDFVVGNESYLLSGIYEEVRRSGEKQLWKIEVNDYGFGAQFGSWSEKDSANWKPWITTGKVTGDVIMYLNEIVCGYGPGGLTAGESKEIPYRLLFNRERTVVKMQHYKVNCDSKGKMTVVPQWNVDDIYNSTFIRVR